MGTNLKIVKDGKTYNVEPLLKKTGRDFIYVPADIDEANLKIQLKKIDPSSQTAELIVGKIKEKLLSAPHPKKFSQFRQVLNHL